MKERPIDLRAHEVRGIVAGRQTQIRRVVNPQPKNGWEPESPPAFGRITSPHPKRGRFGFFVRRGVGSDFPEMDLIQSRFGQPGDMLWGRETFAESDMFDGTPVVAYRAGGCVAVGRKHSDGADYLIHSITFSDEAHVEAWRSSVLMPRWASRITLDVVAVRVERLQDISEADAVASGIEREPGTAHWKQYDRSPGGWRYWESAVQSYRTLHESIHGPESWAANPLVEVCEFKRVEGGAV